jgi:hypothetical protein
MESVSNSRKRVSLKFLLGEFVVGTWRPTCAVLSPAQFDSPNWPEPPDAMERFLVPELDCLLCRKVNADRFPVGLGRYGKWLRYVMRKDVLYLVKLNTPWEDYLKTFSTKARQNIQRSVRKYDARQGDAAYFQTCQTPEDIAWFHREAVRISQQTYQSRLLKAGLPDGPEFSAHLQRLAQEGRARGYLLKDRGEPVAFAWCSLLEGRLAYELVGYLPALSTWSPGTVLLYKILELGFASGDFKLVDFGAGEAQYKSVFATDKLTFADVYFFRPSLKHRLLLWSHFSLGGLSDGMVALLEHLGWKEKVKKWLRRQ